MVKIYMFEYPDGDEFINFNAASVRTLVKLFKALIFAFGTRLARGWFFLPARLRRGSSKKNKKTMIVL